jgi:hypothetical protein
VVAVELVAGQVEQDDQAGPQLGDRGGQHRLVDFQDGVLGRPTRGQQRRRQSPVQIRAGGVAGHPAAAGGQGGGQHGRGGGLAVGAGDQHDPVQPGCPASRDPWGAELGEQARQRRPLAPPAGPDGGSGQPRPRGHD